MDTSGVRLGNGYIVVGSPDFLLGHPLTAWFGACPHCLWRIECYGDGEWLIFGTLIQKFQCAVSCCISSVLSWFALEPTQCRPSKWCE